MIIKFRFNAIKRVKILRLSFRFVYRLYTSSVRLRTPTAFAKRELYRCEYLNEDLTIKKHIPKTWSTFWAINSNDNCQFQWQLSLSIIKIVCKSWWIYLRLVLIILWVCADHWMAVSSCSAYAYNARCMLTSDLCHMLRHLGNPAYGGINRTGCDQTPRVLRGVWKVPWLFLTYKRLQKTLFSHSSQF